MTPAQQVGGLRSRACASRLRIASTLTIAASTATATPIHVHGRPSSSVDAVGADAASEANGLKPPPPGSLAAVGAEAANVLRRKAAVRLRAALRASDVVASLGSDMYGVLLAWIDAESDADGVARKLQASLKQPFNVAGQD